MHRRVLDVGNCQPDHAAIRRLIASRFEAEVKRAHGLEDALTALETGHFDLVLVNRVFDRSGGDGLELIRRLKDMPPGPATPVMLISNYAQFQEQAVALGAEPGFGKSELDAEETQHKLARWLAD